MSQLPPSHLSVITDKSNAAAINQNFNKIHAELQALKRYIKNMNVITEVPAVKQVTTSGDILPNLITDDSFEYIYLYGCAENYYDTGIYPVKDNVFWRFFGNNPSIFVYGTNNFGNDEKVPILFGTVAAVVDGNYNHNSKTATGRSVPATFAPMHMYADYTGGYTLSCYTAAYSETTADGVGKMHVSLIAIQDSTTFNIRKTWTKDFNISAVNLFKWERHILTIPVNDMPNNTNYGCFLITFSSTVPYLLDGVQFVPSPEPGPYYHHNFYMPHEASMYYSKIRF